MQISEIMHQGVTTIEASDTLLSAAKLMRDQDIGALPVIENGKPVGFITDRDIVMACANDGKLEDSVSEAMCLDVISIEANKEVTEAAKLMEQHQISRLMVMEENKLVGILSLSDLLLNLENRHLKAEILEEIKQ